MDRSRENNEGNASAAGRSMGDAAATAAQAVGESLEQGRAALADMQTMLTERSRECMAATETYVRENPWQAVGLAAGMGLIIGLLMNRR